MVRVSASALLHHQLRVLCAALLLTIPATSWPARARVLQHHHNVVQIDDFLSPEELDALLEAGRRAGAAGEPARQDAYARSVDAAAMAGPAVDSVRERIAEVLRLGEDSAVALTFVEDATPPDSEQAAERLEYRYTRALHDGHKGQLEEGAHAPVFSFAIFLTGIHPTRWRRERLRVRGGINPRVRSAENFEEGHLLFPCHRTGVTHARDTGAPTNGSRLDVLQTFLRGSYESGLRSVDAPYTMQAQDPKEMVQMLRRAHRFCRCGINLSCQRSSR